jgi:hypothetical protein
MGAGKWGVAGMRLEQNVESGNWEGVQQKLTKITEEGPNHGGRIIKND